MKYKKCNAPSFFPGKRFTFQQETGVKEYFKITKLWIKKQRKHYILLGYEWRNTGNYKLTIEKRVCFSLFKAKEYTYKSWMSPYFNDSSTTERWDKLIKNKDLVGL